VKIIAINNGDGRELPQQVNIIADSAVIKTNKPLFLPHFAQRFTAKPAIVLHIDRLGKHIAQRFAHRYTLAVAPAIKVTARHISTQQQCEQLSALASSFDGALLLGDFAQVSQMGDINATTVTMDINGDNKGGGTLESNGLDYSHIIASLSTFFTLKMGDIIVVEMTADDFDINIGDTLHASCNEQRLLTIRVK